MARFAGHRRAPAGRTTHCGFRPPSRRRTLHAPPGAAARMHRRSDGDACARLRAGGGRLDGRARVRLRQRRPAALPGRRRSHAAAAAAAGAGRSRPAARPGRDGRRATARRPLPRAHRQSSARSSPPATGSPRRATCGAAATRAGRTTATTARARSATRSTAPGCSPRRSSRAASCAGAEAGAGRWVTIYANRTPHVHDRRRAALRHLRTAPRRHPLAGRDAILARVPRPPPAGL